MGLGSGVLNRKKLVDHILSFEFLERCAGMLQDNESSIKRTMPGNKDGNNKIL